LTRPHLKLLLFALDLGAGFCVCFILLRKKIDFLIVQKNAQIILAFLRPRRPYRQVANLSYKVLIMLLADLARDFSDDIRHTFCLLSL